MTAGVVLLGAVLLGVSLRIEPGSAWFYPATFALAATWTVGAFAAGPLHLGRIRRGDALVRPVLAPLLVGLGLAAVFVAGGLVVREIDWLDRQVRSVVDFADQGSVPLLVVVTLVNGIAEEPVLPGRGLRRPAAAPGDVDLDRLRAGHPRHRQRDAGLRRDHPRRGRRAGAARVRRDPRSGDHALLPVADHAVRAAGALRLLTSEPA
nr:hypothetical protein [Nocardioides convexus]